MKLSAAHVCAVTYSPFNILTVFDIASQSKSSPLGPPHIAAPALLKTIIELKPSHDHWFEQSSYEILYFWVFL